MSADDRFAQPTHPAAVGSGPDAEASCRARLSADPSHADSWNLLGQILMTRGEPAAAIDCFERALQSSPDWLEVLFRLAAAHQGLGRLEDAALTYRRASSVAPRESAVFYNLGNLFVAMSRLDDAIEAYSAAIDLQPNFAAASSNLGLVLSHQGRPHEALACHQRAVQLDPRNAEALTNLGNIFQKLERIDEAIDCQRRAVEINPNLASARYNLSVGLHDRGDLEEAADSYRRSLDLLPNHAVGHSNLGNIHRELGRLDAAADCYRRALSIDPNLPEARWNRSLLWLLRGDWHLSWPEYEWRFASGQVPARPFVQPRWQGELFSGQTLLLHAEQGLGDTLQFIRYAPFVKEKGGQVVVECPAGLMNLLSHCRGIDRIVPYGSSLPDFDIHLPMASLPAVFNTTVETIPSSVPYIDSDPLLVSHWNQRLSRLSGFRIAINWRGRPGRGEYRWRNVPLHCFRGLGGITGVHLISVQKGEGRDELRDVQCDVPIIDLGDELDTASGLFMDTAAIMSNVDLVITSDTAVAHLAGALGVPTWVALPYVPDWRWLLERTDSPWYPTMRLFRQPSRGDWNSVFQDIATALHKRMSQSG